MLKLSMISLGALSFVVLAQAPPVRGPKSRKDLGGGKSGTESEATKDFVPLSCNNAGFERCKQWSSVFQTLPIHMGRLVIPCGECVEFDLPIVSLFGGIDIHGKLLIDDRQDRVIQTTFIAVQGELEISAVGPVDGEPRIHIIMIGEQNQTFMPINENSDACGGRACTIGSKAIAVAGGKLNIHGISSAAPTWLLLHDATTISITTNASAFGHWAKGSEIVIATHTTDWEDNQVRKIVEARRVGVDYVEFVLDRPIEVPTVAIKSPDFATEVALLSRNVVIQAGNTSSDKQGGHIWIMQTPRVAQTLIGIDIQRFGQQGQLGRYPIHIHFCGDSKGTVIAKNTVRQSNQRCIVVHGTDNLEIRENVAFDTKGHCFMLEDGMETGNSFIRNIGIQTGAPAIIIPNYGHNGKETDAEPSTFWITNPSNNWIENTVAGSESSGFWFELLVRGERGHLYSNLDPKRESLGVFEKNTVHSCGGVRMVALFVDQYTNKFCPYPNREHFAPIHRATFQNKRRRSLESKPT
jgi:G8 domain